MTPSAWRARTARGSSTDSPLECPAASRLRLSRLCWEITGQVLTVPFSQAGGVKAESGCSEMSSCLRKKPKTDYSAFLWFPLWRLCTLGQFSGSVLRGHNHTECWISNEFNLYSTLNALTLTDLTDCTVLTRFNEVQFTKNLTSLVFLTVKGKSTEFLQRNRWRKQKTEEEFWFSSPSGTEMLLCFLEHASAAVRTRVRRL